MEAGSLIVKKEPAILSFYGRKPLTLLYTNEYNCILEHAENGARPVEHNDPSEHKRRKYHLGAQTFRRGRALEFLERLEVRRNTLRQQLEQPEFQEIRLMIQGELKAIEAVIDDYIRHFKLQGAE
jgi:hypothetical protein